MKRLLSTPKRLVAASYIGFFIVSILFQLYNLVEDRALRAMDKLPTQRWTTADFKLDGMKPTGEPETFISTDADPKMVLQTSPVGVRRIDVEVEFSIAPGEFNVFYMPKPGMAEYDANFRVWAKKVDETHYVFSLPKTALYGLRMDPGIYAGNRIRFVQIAVNEKQSAFSFFQPSYSWVFYMLFLPALLASAIDFLLQFMAERKNTATKNAGAPATGE